MTVASATSRVESAAAGAPINPFPGLRPFGVGEAHLFFGRESHVEALLEKLQRQRLLAVVGTSGSGKSSLVLAGVLPRLDRGYVTPFGSRWRVAVMRPGDDPLGHLANALYVAGREDEERAYPDAAHRSDAPSSGVHSSSAASMAQATPNLERDLLRAQLERPHGLVEAAARLGLGAGENLLVIVDQFEELFRYAELLQKQRSDPAAAFVKLLLAASEQSVRPIYVMLTLRSDFLGECVRFPGLAESINAGQYLVPLLNRDQRAQAIRGPIGVAGAVISTGLVQRLLNDAADLKDQLPVLQHALMRSFELACADARGSQPVRLDLPHYEAAGELTGALSRHANEAYEALGQKLGREGQLVTERLFRCLTQRAEHGEGIRRPCKVSEVLAVAGTDLGTLREVGSEFVGHGRGFLVQQPSGPLHLEATLDISHESLMRRWERLRQWTADEVAFGRQLQALADPQRGYAGGHKGLLRDPELSLARRWWREQGVTAPAASRYQVDVVAVGGFLERSARAERFRQRALWGSIGFVILGLSVLGLLLYRMGREAKTAEDEAKRAMLDARMAMLDARTSALVVLAKDSAEDSGRAAAFLRETGESASERSKAWHLEAVAVSRRALSWSLGGHTEPVNSATFSADGRRVVTASWDNTARVWDAESGKELWKLAGHTHGVLAVAFGAEGKRVVTASTDETARVWDAENGNARATLEGHTGTVATASFSSDGTRIVTGSIDTSAGIWTTDGESLHFIGRSSAVRRAALRQSGGHEVAEVWDESARRWHDARTALWRALPYCVPEQERIDRLFETSEQARGNHRLCRDTVNACRRGTFEDCDRVVNQNYAP